ncbi:hypothetical protein CF326_g5989 [Tilletia indica]|nr:hypothetical protein CF326_g5989 [Tilletia indica]
MFSRGISRSLRPFRVQQVVRFDGQARTEPVRSLALRSLTASSQTARQISPCRSASSSAGAARQLQYRGPPPSPWETFRSQQPQHYNPPPSSGGYGNGYGKAASWLDPVWVVIGANGLVFFYYQYANDRAKRGDPSSAIWLQRNFTASMTNAMERPWSLLMSSFTHADMGHCAFNMMALYTFGSIVNGMLGPRVFLATYLGAGLTCSIAHIGIEKYQFNRWTGQASKSLLRSQLGISPARRERGAIGASGSIMGLGSLIAFLNPSLKMYVWGVLPVPMWLLIGGYVAYDFSSVALDRRDFVSHAGHLGGVLYGTAYYYFVLRRGRGRVF